MENLVASDDSVLSGPPILPAAPLPSVQAPSAAPLLSVQPRPVLSVQTPSAPALLSDHAPALPSVHVPPLPSVQFPPLPSVQARAVVQSRLETFFYRLGLVLDSLVFGLGLVSDLVIGLAKCSSWSRPSPAIYAFFFSFKTKPLIWLACSANG